MADTKISALPASTTPLAGTEVLPIVQSGVTRQVSVANLTAGRAVNASSVTATSTSSGTSFIPTGAPSSVWAVDGTNAGLLITIADTATYDLAVGSGAIYLWDNGGNGVSVIYTFYGTVTFAFNPQAFYSDTAGTAAKVNIYYNAGTNTYRLENLTGSSKSIYVFTQRLRAAS
jgi:hypothetical protein